MRIAFLNLLQKSKKLTELEDGISDIDCEALNDIYYLWKNATNPEVKEAFDLMIKGGTPSQKDFGYEVPSIILELRFYFGWPSGMNLNKMIH